MSRTQTKPGEPVLRIFADAQGKVFLLTKSGSAQVEVELPVSEETLTAAKHQLADLVHEAAQSKQLELAAELTPAQKTNHEKIAETIDPIRRAALFKKLRYSSSYYLRRSIAVLFSVILIAASYKGVQYSSENFPEWLHFIVLGLYVLVLTFLLYVTGTEENRIKYHSQVKDWAGPHGMLVVPLALMFAAGGVLASILFRLYQRGWVVFEACKDSPVHSVTEGGLMDFSVWHLLNIVPLLQLPSLLQLEVPYCYKQTRVGLLTLIFQALVIIPSFNTIRFYWKHRKTPSEYLFDPYWKPKPKKP